MSLDTAQMSIIDVPAAPAAAGGGARDRGRLTGTFLVLGSCASLQFGAALATTLFPEIGTWATTSFRLALAAVVLLLIVRPRFRHWTRAQWLPVIGFGVTLAAMNGFFYAGIDRIPLGVAVAIEFLGPLGLSAVMSRRPRDLAWIGLALVGMGLFFVNDLTGAGRLDPLGVVFVLIAAACWAAYILASHRVGQTVPGNSGLAMAVTIGAVLVLPFGVSAAPHVVAEPWLLAVGLGAAVMASVIPYSFEFAALRRLPRPVFGVLLSIEPVFATIAGALMLGQGVSLLTGLAIALVVGASAGSTLTAQR
jgi:inner membrane transporter RhtA